jgi:hypothetical protein
MVAFVSGCIIGGLLGFIVGYVTESRKWRLPHPRHGDL